MLQFLNGYDSYTCMQIHMRAHYPKVSSYMNETCRSEGIKVTKDVHKLCITLTFLILLHAGIRQTFSNHILRRSRAIYQVSQGQNSALHATDCTSCAPKPVVNFVCQFYGFQEMLNPTTHSVKTVLASKFKLKLDCTINQLQKCFKICLKQDI